MFPVLEPLTTVAGGKCNHYFAVNVNLREKRFEVMDSYRELEKSENLNKCAREVIAGIRFPLGAAV